MNYLLFQLYIMLMFMSFLRARKPGHSKEENEDYMDVIEYIDMTGSIRQRGVEFSEEIFGYNDGFVTSPLADLIALSKLALGAKGDTLHQLLEAIGASHQSEIGDHIKPLIEDLRQLRVPGLKVDIVSRLYISNTSQLESEFEEDAIDIFNSSATKIDFENSTLVAEYINSWVSSQTNCVINNVVDYGITLKPLLIVNAVFVCGKWKETFDNLGEMDWFVIGVHPAPRSDAPLFKVSSMGRNGIYNFTTYKQLEIIQIPYMDERMSLIIITSYYWDYLALTVNAHKWLNKAMTQMNETQITLRMPFFNINGNNNMFSKAGVTKIFEENSLQQLTKDKYSHVNYTRTRTFIRGHRLGINPARPSNSSETQGIQLTIDRPFIFIVLMNRQQLISGYVTDPR